MKNKLKKIILSSSQLIRVANYFNKGRLKRKFQISYGKNVFIAFSVKTEGYNFFDNNSSITGSVIGYASYIGENSHIIKTSIGRYTSIGPNVKCIFGKHPTDTFVSTHPVFFSKREQVGFTYTDSQKFEEFSKPKDKSRKYSILIGNDVWIGANVTILDGVSIGDGSIVASNALVNKDIEPYTIVGGVPAKQIKKRFSDEQIKFLINFKWWEKPKEWIKTNAELFSNIASFHKKFRNE